MIELSDNEELLTPSELRETRKLYVFYLFIFFNNKCIEN